MDDRNAVPARHLTQRRGLVMLLVVFAVSVAALLACELMLERAINADLAAHQAQWDCMAPKITCCLLANSSLVNILQRTRTTAQSLLPSARRKACIKP